MKKTLLSISKIVGVALGLVALAALVIFLCSIHPLAVIGLLALYISYFICKGMGWI